MDKLFMPNESPATRLKYLESQADGVVEDRYFHQLTENELNSKRVEITDNVINLGDVEEEKMEVMKDFKQRIDPLKSEIKRLTLQVRTGHEERHGKLYKFIDREKRWVYFYDASGNLIENKSRPSNVDEIHVQLKITGTDN